MKLLNAKTLKIEEFFGSKIPKYAILSHRWEEEEVTYQDLLDEEVRSQKRGWAKIRKTCELALVQRLEYVWVDTCCINKQDFSELTEAINSMFNWYARSDVCYAYLSDVDDSAPLERSLWFTRGWTLQELIAPVQVWFFNSSWNRIGSRASFSKVIHRRTGISEKVLSHLFPDGFGIRQQLDEFPVAVRMSWASARETTRDEDRSYSLLGLFGVNMPLLYGEGDRAFIRLQEEIVKETNDLTLFAWTYDTGAPFDHALDAPQHRGILATSPDEFKNSKDLKWSRGIDTNPEFVMTNKGLRITAESIQLRTHTRFATLHCYFLSLGCRQVEQASQDDLGIILVPYSGTHEECVFARGYTTSLMSSNELWKSTARMAREELSDRISMPKKIKKSYFIKKHVDATHTSQAVGLRRPLTIEFKLGCGVDLVKAMPMEEWNAVSYGLSSMKLYDFAAFVEFKKPHLLGKADHFIMFCWTGLNANFKFYLVEKTNLEQDIYKAAMREDWVLMRNLCMSTGKTGLHTGQLRVSTKSVGAIGRPFLHSVEILCS